MGANLPEPAAVAGTRRAFAALCLLTAALVVAGVYRRALGYPFIQDDWSYLSALTHLDDATNLARDFDPVGRLHYRPLGTVAFIPLYRAFGLDPVPAHLLNLLLLAGAALLVAALARRLGADRFTAWAVMTVYAAAVSIHLDPVLWLVGFFDLAGAVCFCGCVLLFLRGNTGLSLGVFGAGLLCKEFLVVLPTLLALTALLSDGPLPGALRAALRRLWPHVVLMAAFLAMRALTGLSPFGLPDDHPYRMKVLGLHLLENAGRYAWWGAEALTPFRDLRPAVGILLAAFLAAAFLWLKRVEARSAPAAWRRPAFLAGWVALALAPVMLLPNHCYRYYLVYGLPAAALLLVECLRGLLRAAGAGPRFQKAALAAYLFLLAATGALWFARKDAAGLRDPYLPGTNHLVHRAAAVRAVQGYLAAARPRVAPGTVFVIGGADLESFDRDWMFRVLCRDITVRAVGADQVRFDAEGAFVPGGEAGHVRLDPARSIRLEVLDDHRARRLPFPP
ncbi:MAG: hypothetical protein KA419_04210 [Acidobacteria bacterium]|nr:hypothetical protein [Acidobacteriota bacterium]